MSGKRRRRNPPGRGTRPIRRPDPAAVPAARGPTVSGAALPGPRRSPVREHVLRHAARVGRRYRRRVPRVRRRIRRHGIRGPRFHPRSARPAAIGRRRAPGTRRYCPSPRIALRPVCRAPDAKPCLRPGPVPATRRHAPAPARGQIRARIVAPRPCPPNRGCPRRRAAPRKIRLRPDRRMPAMFGPGGIAADGPSAYCRRPRQCRTIPARAPSEMPPGPPQVPPRPAGPK